MRDISLSTERDSVRPQGGSPFRLLTDDELTDYTQSIRGCTRIRSLLKTSSQTLDAMGFEWAVFHYYPIVSATGTTARKGIYLHNIPESWYALYRQRFEKGDNPRFRQDPVIHHTLKRTVPGTLSSYMNDPAYAANDPGFRYLKEVLENLGDGITVCVRMKSLCRGYVAAGHRGAVRDNPKLFRQFKLVAEEFCQRYEQLANWRRPKVSLTNREHQVLVLITEGKSNPEIAMILDISTNTVASYTKRLHLKFRTHDKVSLSLKAIALGVLDQPIRP